MNADGVTVDSHLLLGEGGGKYMVGNKYKKSTLVGVLSDCIEWVGWQSTSEIWWLYSISLRAHENLPKLTLWIQADRSPSHAVLSIYMHHNMYIDLRVCKDITLHNSRFHCQLIIHNWIIIGDKVNDHRSYERSMSLDLSSVITGSMFSSIYICHCQLL